MGFEYEKDPNFDFIIEEKGNMFIALRKISWGGRDAKLDLRKWYSSDGGETMSKGVSFTDEGAHELTKTLISEGYGYTDEIINSIKDRDDFRSCLNKVLDESDPHYDKDVIDNNVYYDPTTSLFEDLDENSEDSEAEVV